MPPEYSILYLSTKIFFKLKDNNRKVTNWISHINSPKYSMRGRISLGKVKFPEKYQHKTTFYQP
jgi:hypothetical protein